MIYNKKILNQAYRIDHLQDLYYKKNDVLIIQDYINNNENLGLVSEFKKFEDSNLSFKFSDAGSSFPIPYSLVNSYFHSNPIQEYLNSAKNLNNKIDVKCSSNPLSHLIEKIEKLGLKRLSLNEDNYLSPVNFRRLNSLKNGIDLHCENSFKDDLDENFKAMLYSKIDIENILSFFIVLQKPETGGELIIYNQEWDNVKIPTFELTKNNREDKSGNILDNYSTKKTISSFIDLEVNDLIIFRGAQIYHAINKIYGNKDRITVGGFIGQSKTNAYDFFFWA